MSDTPRFSLSASDPVELLEARPSTVQLVAVVGIVAGLLGCLVLVGVAMVTDSQLPDPLWATLGALGGSLGTLLVGTRR